MNSILKKYQHERLAFSNRTYGYFLFESSPNCEMWRVVFEHAKTMTLMALQRDIASMRVEASYRDEFMQDLVTGNIRRHEESLNRAKRFGWELVGHLRTVIFDIDCGEEYLERAAPRETSMEMDKIRDRVYSVCKHDIRSAFQDVPCLDMDNSIIFILNVDKCADFMKKLHKSCEEIRSKVLTWTGFSVSAGVGGEKKDFYGIKESYEEARRAIEMMRPLNDDGIYVWDEMGILTILAPVADSKEAERFFSSRLGRLGGASELLRTLRILVEEDWNFKAAARRMNIHYNTIHYRYEKIHELSGVDLSTGESRLEVAVALKLLYLNPKLGESGRE
jgi:purine catabolism regulator